MFASARAALHSTNSSSRARTFIGASVPRAVAVKPVANTSFTVELTHLFVRLLPAVARAADEDHPDEHGERDEVDQLRQPVARVGEEHHRASRCSGRPRAATGRGM